MSGPPRPHQLIHGRTAAEVNVPVLVDDDGKLILSGSVSSAGTIADGVNGAIVATVFDLPDSNPLATVLVDANGDRATPGDATAANQATEISHLAVLAANSLDYDTGAGTDEQVIVGIALPSAGGAVAGGTTTNPVRTDPTGTTTQPVKAVPSDIDITTNANHADKFFSNTGAVTDGIIWSPAAGKRWHVTTLVINVSAACVVTIEDDVVAGDVTRMKFEFAANSGVALTFSTEHPFASAEDAADLLITTTAGNVYVTAVGYEV